MAACVAAVLAAARADSGHAQQVSKPPNAPAAAKPSKPLKNLQKLSATLYSGGEPKNNAAFSKLAEMGVRTVVSVDGVKPNVAAAAKHGLRYVHIPVGYDGVDTPAQSALTRLIREAKSPIYIHCHHGKHRGPAAAAIACIAADQMNHAQAEKYLQRAGTGQEYPGLWRDVAQFTAPPADAKLPPLVETAEVDSMAAAMAQLDRAWDGLKLCQAAGWKTPPDHADLAPQHQALLVWEGLRETERANEYTDDKLALWLRDATAQAEQLHQSLQAARHDAATAAFKQLESGCAQCHKQYRN